MKVIGITGGIGSGKSVVSWLLEEHFNAYIINTDKVAHMLMEKGQISYELIVDYFGTDILDNEGAIIRGELAKKVYGKPDELKKLNSFSHPYVMEYVKEQIQKQSKYYSIIGVESALPVEARFNELCDISWYVHTPMAIRRQRLKDSRNYSDEKLEAIFSSQLTDDEYRKLTQDIIENDGTIENLIDKIQLSVEKL